MSNETRALNMALCDGISYGALMLVMPPFDYKPVRLHLRMAIEAIEKRQMRA